VEEKLDASYIWCSIVSSVWSCRWLLRTFGLFYQIISYLSTFDVMKSDNIKRGSRGFWEIRSIPYVVLRKYSDCDILGCDTVYSVGGYRVSMIYIAFVFRVKMICGRPSNMDSNDSGPRDWERRHSSVRANRIGAMKQWESAILCPEELTVMQGHLNLMNFSANNKLPL
jgi:hypothetical protein